MMSEAVSVDSLAIGFIGTGRLGKALALSFVDQDGLARPPLTTGSRLRLAARRWLPALFRIFSAGSGRNR